MKKIKKWIIPIAVFVASAIYFKDSHLLIPMAEIGKIFGLGAVVLGYFGSRVIKNRLKA